MKTRILKALLLLGCVITVTFAFAAEPKGKTEPSKTEPKNSVQPKKATPKSDAGGESKIKSRPKIVRIVRSTPPVSGLLSTAATPRPSTDINFNGLIDQSGKNRHRLASRVATKTKVSRQQRHTRPHIATIAFDDLDMKMKIPTSSTKREADSIAPPRLVNMNPSSTMSVELVRSSPQTAGNP